MVQIIAFIVQICCCHFIFLPFVIVHATDNKKGLSFSDRFIDILSDVSNLNIPRCLDAGSLVGDGRYVVLHNGIIVERKGYYNDFSDILVTNKGVHEPAEERLFALVLKQMKPDAVMIELGSFWTFYTIWFAKVVPNPSNYCVEAEKPNLELGIRNAKANSVRCHFTKAKVGKCTECLNAANYIVHHNLTTIDLLHMDVQGAEGDVLNQIAHLLDAKAIQYLFVSTHSQKIHLHCVQAIMSHSYRIIASMDFDNDTFMYDGMILATPAENMAIPHIDLGCRRTTPLRHSIFENIEGSGNACAFLPKLIK